MFPGQVDRSSPRTSLFMKVPDTFKDQHRGADGTIEQRLVECRHPNGMPCLKTLGYGGQVKDHHNLCQSNSRDHCWQQGVVFNLIGGEHQFAQNSKESQANKKVESNGSCIPGFTL